MFLFCRHPIPFNAFFVTGTKDAFSVSPSSGELHPPGTTGTRMFVSFNPKMYGKAYKTRLIVQVSQTMFLFIIAFFK